MNMYESKPRWVKHVSKFYCILLVPIVLSLILAIESVSGHSGLLYDTNGILYSILYLITVISLIVGITIGFKKGNDLNFSSKEKKLFLTPAYLIAVSFFIAMLADILGSYLRNIPALRHVNTEDPLLYTLVLVCTLLYYYLYNGKLKGW